VLRYRSIKQFDSGTCGRYLWYSRSHHSCGSVSGAVLSDQVKNLDWRARKATPKGKASTEELDEVRAKIAALLGIR
jgi:mRNA-degrading endonuclease toxin of MazEF toxin-antitoxin module